MRRRDFIKGIAGSAIAWPLAARAQQPERIRRIGVLMGIGENDAGGQAEVAALKRGLQALGWTEGRNLEVKYSWSGAEPDRIQASAKEFVGLKPDVIVARAAPVLRALLTETHTIPIVFTVVSDPVGAGFVQSYARPGGNVTGFPGFEFSFVGKYVQMLTEIAPQLRRVAYLYNPKTLLPEFLRSVESAASSIPVQLFPAPVHDPAEFDATLAALAREPGAGFVALPDIFLTDNRAQIIALAAKNGLPAIYPGAFWTTKEKGGLISYGPDTVDLFYRAASYVDRILKGEKSADLPVQAPTKYELVINLKTAKALGLTVPASLLAHADKVIE